MLCKLCQPPRSIENMRENPGTTWFCSLCHGLRNRAGAPMVVEKKPAQQSCAKVSSFDNPPFSSVRRFLRRATFCRRFRSFMAGNSVEQAPDLQLYDVCYCFPSFHVV